MNNRHLFTLILSASVALSVAPHAALAAPDTNQTDVAKAKFKAALELYDKKNFASALAIFREVVELNASPNARLYVARCHQELRQAAEAYNELSITIRDADALAATEARYVATRDAAAAEKAELASKVALITVAVVGDVPGLTLKLNGQVIDSTRIRSEIAATPGSIVVEIEAPGKRAYRKELVVTAGKSETLAVVLEAASSGPEAASPDASKGFKLEGIVRQVGVGVAGLGVVGFGMLAIAGVAADNKYKSVYRACGGVQCTSPAYADAISEGRTLEAVANAGLVIGIAGALGGAAMIVFGGPKEKSVGAAALPGGGWVSYQSSF